MSRGSSRGGGDVTYEDFERLRNVPGVMELLNFVETCNRENPASRGSRGSLTERKNVGRNRPRGSSSSSSRNISGIGSLGQGLAQGGAGALAPPRQSSALRSLGRYQSQGLGGVGAPASERQSTELGLAGLAGLGNLGAPVPERQSSGFGMGGIGDLGALGLEGPASYGFEQQPEPLSMGQRSSSKKSQSRTGQRSSAAPGPRASSQQQQPAQAYGKYSNEDYNNYLQGLGFY